MFDSLFIQYLKYNEYSYNFLFWFLKILSFFLD